ncbi:MAG: hypothetical protein N2A97_05860 [Thermodesulfobacteriales bacterium]
MNFLSRYKLVLLLIFTLVLLQSSILLAQSSEKDDLVVAQTPAEYVAGKMALIPFNSKNTLANEQSDDSLSQIERYLTISLYEALVSETSGMPDVEIIPIQKSDTEYSRLRSGKPKIYYRDIAIDVGRVLGADTVMVGVISRYSDRGGSQWATDSPSTVSFSVDLLSTKDGGVLWGTSFTETQKPLFDNLFEIKKFVKRKGKWITADEMAKEGARKIAHRFSTFLLENR